MSHQPRYVQPVQTGTEVGWIVYEAGALLVGFIRQDAVRVPVASIIGPHVLLRPLAITGWQFRSCCKMPGVGYVER